MKRRFLKVMMCLALVLSCLTAPIAATAASNAAYILKVTADYARVRTTGAGGENVIAKVRKGTKVLYGGENYGQYCKVYTTSGKAGYIYRKYLASYGAVSKSKIYRTKTATPFYTRSGNTLKRNGTVAKNQFVLVYKRNGDWVYVKSVSGKGGYMKRSALKKVF